MLESREWDGDRHTSVRGEVLVKRYSADTMGEECRSTDDVVLDEGVVVRGARMVMVVRMGCVTVWG